MLASGRGQSGREMMCTVISFVSFLVIFVYSHQPQFVLILRCFNTFSSAGLVAFMFGFCYFKNHIYIYICVWVLFCFFKYWPYTDWLPLSKSLPLFLWQDG